MLAKNPASTVHVYCNRPIGKFAAEFLPPHFRIHRLNEPSDIIAEADTPSTKPLWPHQVDALKALREDEWDVQQLAMPCGAGKTRTFLEYLTHVGGRAVIVSPRRKLADQTLKQVHGPKMLVDSDHGGSTEKDDVSAFWKAHDRCVLSTTLQSWDSIVSHLQPEPRLVIFDESHNATAAHVDLSTARQTLLVSATPNVHEDDDDDAKPSAYASAPIIYHMTIAEALQRSIIADYKLYLPILENGDPRDPQARAAFLLDGLYRVTNARRVVVFGSSWEDVDAVLEAVRAIHKRDLEESKEDPETCTIPALWAESYKGDLNRNQRERLESEFQEFDGIALLGSVDVLREGADLYHCDAVYIMDVTTNARRLVQAMMRCMRLSYPGKVASVFLWAPDQDIVPKALSTLREEDPEYTRKIRGHNARALTGSADDQERWASREAVWLKETIDAISVRAIAAHKKALAKARLLCDEYKTRKSWTYKRDELFPAALGGGSKTTFVNRCRAKGRQYLMSDQLRETFMGVDGNFFDRLMSEWSNTTTSQKVDRLIKAFTKDGKVPVQKTQMGRWLSNVRSGNTTIDEANRSRLERASIRTTPQPTERSGWLSKSAIERVHDVIEYKRINKRDPPQSTPQGRWISSIRIGNTNLDDVSRTLLEKAGVRTLRRDVERSPETSEWISKTIEQRVDATLDFASTNSTPIWKAPHIGPWLKSVRSGRSKIDDTSRARLDAAGIRTKALKRKRNE